MLRYLDPRRWLAVAQDFLSPPAVEPAPDTGDFSPSYADICVARAILKSRGLPTEIVLEVLDWAEYTPIREFTSTELCTVHDPGATMRRCITAGVLSKDTVRSLAARQAEIKVREIEFVFSSHDQGWTSEGADGTFNTSSWLEVSIVRPIAGFQRPSNVNSWRHPIRSPGSLQTELAKFGEKVVTRPEEAGRGIQNGEGNLAWYLQGNRVASERRFEEYRVVWGGEHPEGNEGAGNGVGFLEALREGDEIIVWARAKYPGWQCVVESIIVTVRYSFLERDSNAPA